MKIVIPHRSNRFPYHHLPKKNRTNRIMEIEAAQPIIPAPPTTDLLDLNDDCLHEILGHLSVSELSAMASTCHRLQTLSRQSYTIWKRDKCLVLSKRASSFDHEPHFRFRELPGIFRQFGDLISDMSVTFNITRPNGQYSEKRNTLVYKLMAKYCTGPIRYLKLDSCRSPVCDAVDATTLFRNVRQMKLVDCDRTCISFLSAATALEHLIISSNQFDGYLSFDSPQLRSLTLTGSNNFYSDAADDAEVNTFLRQHRQLNELYLYANILYNMDVVGAMVDLNVLHLVYPYEEEDGDHITALASLPNLRVFVIEISQHHAELVAQFFKQTASANTLEELMIKRSDSRTFESLKRLTNLKILEFHGNYGFQLTDQHLTYLYDLCNLRELCIAASGLITADGLCGLCSNLTQLVELQLIDAPPSENPKLKRSTYRRIGEICRRRNKPLNLYIYSAGIRNTNLLYEDENLQEFLKYYDECEDLADLPREMPEIYI